MAPLRSIGQTGLEQIAASMHPRKALGLDGVPNAALTVALRQQPEPFRRVFQECLDMSCFPQPWKKQRLVLLPKPGKSPGEPSSFLAFGASAVCTRSAQRCSGVDRGG